jgi:hypothetical protein
MSKGLPVKQNKMIRAKIAGVLERNPDYTPKQVQREIRLELKSLKEKNPDMYIPDNWPGIGAIRNLMKDMRPKLELMNEQGLDEPWSLGCLIEHDLPAEVIPLLLDIQKEIYSDQLKTLTIREAFWISKLHNVIKPTIANKKLRLEATTNLLHQWAILYATEHRISEISNATLDTSKLDRMLTTLPMPFLLLPTLSHEIETCQNIEKCLFLANNIDNALRSLEELYKKYPEAKTMKLDEVKMSKEEKELCIRMENILLHSFGEVLDFHSLKKLILSDKATRMRIETFFPHIIEILRDFDSHSNSSGSVDKSKEASHERSHSKKVRK